MRPGAKLLLLAMPAIGLLIPSANAEILQDEGFLQPFNQPNVCDQGETHLLWNPCTGASTFVFTLTSLFDCQHVYVEGPNVGISQLCPMITPTIIKPVSPVCLVQVRDLTVRRVPGGHRVDWAYYACADSFDVIRGTVSSLTPETVGDVICLADDRIHSFVDDLTGDVPQAGEAFSYLVRPNGPAGFEHYGYSSLESQRTPASGDCPAD